MMPTDITGTIDEALAALPPDAQAVERALMERTSGGKAA